jgi:hypothetical protein
MGTVKLPREFIEGKPRILRDLEVGESAMVGMGFLLLDEDDSCWLFPHAPLDDFDGGPMELQLKRRIRVERRANGYFVTILRHQRWQVNDLTRIQAERFPVAKIDIVDSWNDTSQD